MPRAVIRRSPPRVLRERGAPGWVRTLRKLSRLDISTIVPGHGPLCGPSEIHRNLEVLEALLAADAGRGGQA